MTTKAETEALQPQPRMPGAPEAGRGRQDPPLEPPEGAWPWDTLISDLWLQTGFQPSGVWPQDTHVMSCMPCTSVPQFPPLQNEGSGRTSLAGSVGLGSPSPHQQ